MVVEETTPEQDERWMWQAYRLAQRAGELDEVPVGAVVVRAGRLLGSGYNRPITTLDPTAHAEVVALRQAALHCANYRLPGATLYVTLEPCAMCAGALVHARLARVVFGAYEPRFGACGSASCLYRDTPFNHYPQVTGGVLADPCSELLRAFFRRRRG